MKYEIKSNHSTLTNKNIILSIVFNALTIGTAFYFGFFAWLGAWALIGSASLVYMIFSE